jgi:phosphate transport system substrate-binding protein
MADMKRTSGFFTIGLAFVLVIALIASGCTQAPSGSTPGPERTGAGVHTLKVTGSTTVLPIAQAAGEVYMDTHAEADIQVSGGGSSVGVQAVGEGTADIGMSSRDLKSEEKTRYPGLVTTVIGNDGIAMIVHPSNTVSSLTPEQVKKIYLGNYTNWKELGGSDSTIVVIGRDSASGTREFFTEKVMEKADTIPGMLEKNSNGAVKQTVAQTPGAIGYVGLGYLDNDVKALGLNVNGEVIAPTVSNVLDGKYPVSRPLLMLTKGEPQGLAQNYIDFILSKDGQAIVINEGYVPL